MIRNDDDHRIGALGAHGRHDLADQRVDVLERRTRLRRIDPRRVLGGIETLEEDRAEIGPGAIDRCRVEQAARRASSMT